MARRKLKSFRLQPEYAYLVEETAKELRQTEAGVVETALHEYFGHSLPPYAVPGRKMDEDGPGDEIVLDGVTFVRKK